MKRTLSLLAALLIAIGAGSLGAYAALQPHASGSPKTAVRTSHVLGVASHSRLTSGSGLAPGVQELARNQGINVAALKPVAAANGAHPAHVYAATEGSATCAYLTGGTGAVGGCTRLGTQLLAPRIAIVDRGTYVWGLAAPTVSSIQARIGGRVFVGSVSSGIFTIEIPDGSHGTGPITLAATADGSTTTIALPGIPVPLP
jgi:hypothetical protein